LAIADDVVYIINEVLDKGIHATIFENRFSSIMTNFNLRFLSKYAIIQNILFDLDEKRPAKKYLEEGFRKI
jgi:hypothetical protein